ncbi:hypothetical protein [Metaclostridioides mangenotii]|uniref:hypothetical protein n=1 Tax=Metaclostridioides mangenotii TaxID=1540 RepID=UPI000B0F34F5|nr:hypothetical protein [Clostridioides mangenotii]
MDIENLMEKLEGIQDEFNWTKVKVYLNSYEECLDFVDENNNNLASLRLDEVTKINK